MKKLLLGLIFVGLSSVVYGQNLSVGLDDNEGLIEARFDAYERSETELGIKYIILTSPKVFSIIVNIFIVEDDCFVKAGEFGHAIPKDAENYKMVEYGFALNYWDPIKITISTHALGGDQLSLHTYYLLYNQQK